VGDQPESTPFLFNPPVPVRVTINTTLLITVVLSALLHLTALWSLCQSAPQPFGLVSKDFLRYKHQLQICLPPN